MKPFILFTTLLFLFVELSQSTTQLHKKFYKGIQIADDTNFETVIFNNEAKYTFVNFYSTSCGHCNKLGPKYQILGEIFNNTQVQIVQIEAKKNQRIRQKEKIIGFPTLRLYGFDGSHVASFNGIRTVGDMTNFITSHTGVQPIWPDSSVELIEDSSSLEQLTQGKDFDGLVIAFITPWLEDWNTRLSQFEKAARSFKGSNVKFVKIDATKEENTDVVTKFRIDSYPTLIYLDGKTSKLRVLEEKDLNTHKIERFINESDLGITYNNLEELESIKENIDDDSEPKSRGYGFHKDGSTTQEKDEDEELNYRKLRDL